MGQDVEQERINTTGATDHEKTHRDREALAVAYEKVD